MIGQILKTLREEQGLQAQYVASKINVAKSTYSGYENNKSQPDYEILERLADFFNVSVDYLLGRSAAKHTTTNESEQTIDQQLEEVLEQLAGEGKSLMFKGQPMSEQTKEALLMSLKNTLALAEKMAEMEKKNK